MDESEWPQLVGVTVLVEGGPLEATGMVAAADSDTVTVSFDGAAGWKDGDDHEPGLGAVSVSVFAPDALYRIQGPASVKGFELTVGPGMTVERIQRRKWPRRRMDLPVTVCPVEDGRHLAGIPGRTVDLGLGGMCVETLRPVEGEGNPMVIVNLPDGTTIVCLTSTVAVEDLGDGWRYRLVFAELDQHDRARLAVVVEG